MANLSDIMNTDGTDAAPERTEPSAKPLPDVSDGTIHTELVGPAIERLVKSAMYYNDDVYFVIETLLAVIRNREDSRARVIAAETARAAEAEAARQYLKSIGLTLEPGEIWDPELGAKMTRVYGEDGALHTIPRSGDYTKCGLTPHRWAELPGVEYRECISCFMGTVSKPSGGASSGGTDAASSIVSIPGVCGGVPIIENTRIPVWLLVEMQQAGANEIELLQAYPVLSARTLAAAWNYYAAHKDEIDKQIADNDGGAAPDSDGG